MLKIDVTAEDIAKGIQNDCEACPIALALSRAVPGADFIEVDGDANYELDDVTYYARFPESAKNFVTRFDAGETVEPFTFEAEFAPMVYDWDMGDDGE